MYIRSTRPECQFSISTKRVNINFHTQLSYVNTKKYLITALIGHCDCDKQKSHSSFSSLRLQDLSKTRIYIFLFRLLNIHIIFF